MSNLYVVFTKTNTKLGYIIRKFIQYKYNHVFVCDSLYLKGFSFGRKYYKLAFVGGLVEENLNRILYPKKTAEIKIYKIPVSELQLECYNSYINRIKNSKKSYLYNNLAFINIIFKKKLSLYNVHNCVTFVLKLLLELNISLDRYVSSDEINFISPKDLDNLLKNYEHREMLIDETSNFFYDASPSTYLKKFTILQMIKINLKYIWLLFSRIKHT